MAKGDNDFSVLLPDAGQIIAPPQLRQTDSPLAGALGNLSQGIRTFQQSVEDNRARKKQEKIEKDKARDVQGSRYFLESVFKNQDELKTGGTLDPWADVALGMGGSSPEPTIQEQRATTPQGIIQQSIDAGEATEGEVEEVRQHIAGKVDKISNANAAVAQGALPRVAADALVRESMMDTLDRYPGLDPKLIFSLLEDMGIKNLPFQTMKLDMDMKEDVLKKKTEQYTASVARGRLMVAPENLGSYNDDQLAAMGLQAMQIEQNLKMKNDQIDLQIKMGNLKEQEAKALREENARMTEQLVWQQAHATLGPIMQQAQRLMIGAGQPGTNPVAEGALAEYTVALERAIPTLVYDAVGQLGIVDPEKAKSARDYFTKMFTDVYLTPLKTRNSQDAQLAETLSSHLKINTMQAYPLLGMFKAAGIDLPMTDALFGALGEDTKSQLAKEIGGLVNQDPMKMMTGDTASLFVGKIWEVLKGDNTLNNLNLAPARAREAFKAVRAAAGAGAKAYNQGLSKDPENFLNAQMEVAVQASQVSGGSDIKTLGNTVFSLIGYQDGTVHTRKALDTLIGQGNEEAVLAGRGTRAAMANALSGLRRSVPKLRSADGWKVKFDNRTGQYAVIDETPNSGPTYQRMGREDGISLTVRNPARSRPPADMVRAAKSLNEAAMFLAKTENWDAEGLKGSEAELLRYYLTDQPTKAMRDQIAKQDKTKSDSSSAVTALQKATQELNQGTFKISTPLIPGENGNGVDENGNVVVTGAKGQKVSIMSVDNIQRRFADNPIKVEVETKASAAGVPSNIALALAGHEGKFNPKAKADAGNGRTAWGPMQIVDKFHDSETMKLYGKKVKDLSPQQNVEYGMRYLASLFQQTGSWQDALSMYHSGVSFAEAGGRNDGHINTQDYVLGLIAAAGEGSNRPT